MNKIKSYELLHYYFHRDSNFLGCQSKINIFTICGKQILVFMKNAFFITDLELKLFESVFF